MGVVVYDRDRGRRVIHKTANTNPRKGLTLRMILKANAAVGSVVRAAETCHILQKKANVFTNRKAKLQGFKFIVQDDEGTIHQGKRAPVKHECLVFEQQPNSGKLSAKNVNIVVSCDCEFFLYNNEYALAHFGASFIKHSNGQPPRVTNPGLIPYTCKHLHKALTHILSSDA